MEPCHAAHYPRCRRPARRGLRTLSPPRTDRATQDGLFSGSNSKACPITRSPAWPAFPGLPLPAISKSFLPRRPDAIRRFPWKGRRGQPRRPLGQPGRALPSASATPLRQAQQTIEQRTGLHRGLTQVRRFLLRLGLVTRKVAAVPLPPKEHASRTRPGACRFLDDELEPQLRQFVRASATSILWMPATSSSARSSATCGASCAVVNRAARAASVTTCWGVARRQPPVDPGGQPQLHQRHLGAAFCCARSLRPVWGVRSRWCWTMPATRNAPWSRSWPDP